MSEEKKEKIVDEMSDKTADTAEDKEIQKKEVAAESKQKEKAESTAPESDKEETKADKKKESKPVKTEKKEKEKKPVKDKIGNLNFYAGVRDDIANINTGDVVRASYRVIEGGKERIQVFEGTVIAVKNSGISKTVTVRKTSFGIAVERIFPLNSKLLQKIEIIKHSKVRRSKLYYLRKLSGKAARLKELRK